MYCKYQESKLADMNNLVNDIQLDGNSTNKSIKKHDQLLKSSGEILRKLEEVRQTKAYEMMKYETISRMNASNVKTYLRQQHLKLNEVSSSGMDAVLQKHHEEKKNRAAVFRRITRQKQIDRIFCTWKWVPLEKRIQYIEAISERMSGGTVPRRIDHSIIKNKLDKHKKMMYANANNFVRREQLIKSIENDLTLLNGIKGIDDLMAINSNNFSARKTIMAIK
ncbi:unnamed protein product [Onchocerca ochengi]|uniref:Uncharacterized protein n=1 Tax=Onchocerca ochengi TaxID=42157 RepID=A0A182E9F6_ONCOC|nr:unnamed protein product [Onchocerca ochengi]VDK73994.1 unnamed protein product [Onchocerca ochengi]